MRRRAGAPRNLVPVWPSGRQKFHAVSAYTKSLKKRKFLPFQLCTLLLIYVVMREFPEAITLHSHELPRICPFTFTGCIFLTLDNFVQRKS